MTLVGGLLSGTSMDGADALLLEVSRSRVSGEDLPGLRWRVAAFASRPWDPPVRDRIREACRRGRARELADLHAELGEAFARVFLDLLEEAGVAPREVAALGSHGQTVWHRPPEGGHRGATLQLGDPATLAERTGIPVVSDFRSRDVAAGGHGAPLVPWADLHFFHRPGQGRALQNLGGMGNVTWLPPDGASERVVAFDTGPGVALLDAAASRASEGAEPWDVEGRRAARGREDAACLAGLLDDPFFRAPPPRSTGRERFGDDYLEALVERLRPGSESDWDDVLATLTALTAESVALAYRDHLPEGGVHEVVLTGGGARNPALVARIRRALGGLTVRTGSEALGMDPDAREAACFALLAWAHLEGLPANLPQVTGAGGPRILGQWTPGHGR